MLHMLSKSSHLIATGPEATIEELTDFISAAQVIRADDEYLVEEVTETKLKPSDMYYANGRLKKRKLCRSELNESKKERWLIDEPIRLPKLMIGFGLPEELMSDDAPSPVLYRTLPEQPVVPPYFYYENVALAPKGVWDKIKRFLYDIEQQFVDSMYFCAAAKKRAYVHNLPIKNKFPLVLLPPRTINEALPMTKRWWATWDPIEKMNCLQTAIASARLIDRIRKALEDYKDDPPKTVQKYVMEQCKKWNLVWVGKHKVAPLC
ncbi:DNA methyltransferase [Lithospermum erythrorhizon]|uniref:DNA methyltransferase n=1 Tax=Lithospermum erythrorhizon TaxID=34254 RepID=A0AAV3RAX5_LITER